MTQSKLEQIKELKHNDGPIEGQKDNKPIEISILINYVYYFLETLFIMTVEGGYRLLVIHEGKLLTDKTYKTAKGARIAFSKLYGVRAWRDDVKAEWSRFYSPDAGWVEKKLSAKKATEREIQKIQETL